MPAVQPTICALTWELRVQSADDLVVLVNAVLFAAQSCCQQSLTTGE